MDFLVSIIIPAYNEEKAIASLIKRVKELYPSFELMVIDDGSTDATAKVAAEAGVRVIRHPYNMGNGAAIKTGIRNAQGDIVVMLDGDGQHRPEDIAKLLAEFPRYDAVIGARDKNSASSKPRRWANRLYNMMASYISGRKIEDLTSGFRAFKRGVIKKYLYLLPNGFSYPATSLLALIKGGHSIHFIEITTDKRVGKSKIKLLRDGARFLWTIIRVGTLFSPAKIFIPISLASFLLGVVYGGYIILWQGRFSNMAQLLLVAALLIFLMGLISEQIALLRFSRSEDEKS